MIKKKSYFWIGIGILALLGISYFIKVNVDKGFNYQTSAPLLGVLIFYNPFILALYVLIGIILIFKGLRK